MLNVEIRDFNSEKREVVGYAVPWDQEIDLGGVKEKFTRGAIESSDVPLFFNHTEPVGVVLEGLDTDEGFAIRARISDTALGNDVVTLIKDKAIRAFSVGFSPVDTDKSQGILNRMKVKLHEVSLVGVGHYEGAQILAYRSEPQTTAQEAVHPQNEENKEEVNMETNSDILKEELETLKEDVLALQRNNVPVETKPVLAYRSYGDYIKGIARQEDEALTLYRAWTGGTSTDSVFHNGWVGDKVKIVDKPRKVLNAFNRAALPDEGLNVEYAKLNSNTTAVGVQSPGEGELLSYGKISVTTATAPVKTYGGYTTMSRQEVERASVNIVDKAFSAMAAKYATATNGAVRAALVAATLPTVTVGALASSTAVTWLGAVVDAATALDVNDYTLDQIIVSGDVFKKIATLSDSAGRPLLYTDNPSNNIGSVSGLSATLAGVPVVVDPGAAALTAWFASKEAVTTYESAGAPLRLQDADITNLSAAFSVYGYLAVAVHDVNGVQEATIS